MSEEAPPNEKSANFWATIRRFSAEFKPHRASMVLIVLTLFVGTVLTLSLIHI